jgi:DnaJ like chaperone protein
MEQFGKFGKWITGGLGFVLLGPIGGIVGFALGAFLEKDDKKGIEKSKNTAQGDFAMSLLVLVAAVMKADKKILKSELDYVKGFFIKNFGTETTKGLMLMLRDMLKKEIPVQDVSRQIGANLDYSSRLQLLHFLFGIAQADGQIHNTEIRIIDLISTYMGINYSDLDSIKSMFIAQIDSSYKILEISKSADNDEVKKAYKKMAIKYHPDKVSHLGEDFQNIAKEKFQKVNEAFNKIKKERRMN